MIFSLEALQAEKGDCLLVHFGSKTDPKIGLIDGGPKTVYDNTLKKRLVGLSTKLAGGNELPLEFVMISHIDDDHIRGILDWLADWDVDESSKCEIGDFWFNSFEEGLKEIPAELRTASIAASGSGIRLTGSVSDIKVAAVIASVQQGRNLRDKLNELGIAVNRGGGELLIADGAKTTGVFGKGTTSKGNYASGLKLTVLSPNKKRLQALFKKWKEAVKTKRAVDVAAYRDGSVYNLSSIVVLAEFGEKRMLLTGDARGDDILGGMSDAGLFKESDVCHVDLLKIPHHGSDRNVERKFFECVTADNYVISANGENDNPDDDVLYWIAQARGRQSYTISLTNESNPAQPILAKNIAKAIKRAPELKKHLRFRESSRSSITVDLLDQVTY